MPEYKMKNGVPMCRQVEYERRVVAVRKWRPMTLGDADRFLQLSEVHTWQSPFTDALKAWFNNQRTRKNDRTKTKTTR